LADDGDTPPVEATALDLEESESVRVFTRDRRRRVGFIRRDIFSFYHN
jgi:hypothetical protein